MSTAMLSQPATVSIPATMANAASPTSPTKKRRRRAPVTGAAEDCFTCHGLGVKCDRRRPYCGPCLDSGMACKGYRTQLTWNVGVASRGKLRGMTLPITTAAMVEQQKDSKRVTKKSSEDKGNAQDRQRRARTVSAGAAAGYSNDGNRSQAASNAAKLTIVTNYDFVNMEPPSTGSSATSRSASTLSAPPSAAMSAGSPSLRSGLPPHRMDQRSPQSGVASPYSASSQPPHYHSPVPPHQQLQPGHHYSHHQPQQSPPQQQQHYQHSPVNGGQVRKSPYPQHVSLPPQQQPTPSMLLSPMSEYEPSYQQPPQQYPISSAPSSAPLYDVVTGVSSGSYHPSPSITVTSSAGSFTPMSAPAPAPSRIVGEHYHHVQHSHHPNGQSWNGQNVPVSNLHQHVQSGSGNLSDLLYDEDMLAPGHPKYSVSVSE